MKVRAIATFENLKDIFTKGDILEIEPVLRTKDVELHSGQKRLNKETGKWTQLTDPIIAKSGEYNGYILITADSRRYSESEIQNFIGHIQLKEMFEKI